MSPIWQIEFFGGLCGRSETGAEFAPGVSRAGTLFACLALAPTRALNRDYLAALLWPEADTAAARTRLRQELSVLRRQLEPDGVQEGSVLIRERDRIALVPGAIVTDVERFNTAFTAARNAKNEGERERLLDEAATLYRGELLPGYDYDGLALERAHLAHCYETALRQLAALRETRGDQHGAETCLRRLVAQNPYAEEAYAALMRLYAAQGQPTRVREQYRKLERILRKEFDAEPSEAARQLMERLCRDAAVSAPLRPPDAPSLRTPGSLPEMAPLDDLANGCHLPAASPLTNGHSPVPGIGTLAPVGKQRLPWRALAGALALLVCLGLFVRHRIGAHPKSPGSSVSLEIISRLAPPEWGRHNWVYHYTPHPGDERDSEPKAMVLIGPNVFVTGFVQTKQEDVDILTLKISAEGKLLSRARYSSPEHDCDRAFSIDSDQHGGLYVAGESYIPAGTGVPEGWRLVVIHYDANLKQLWASRSKVVARNTDRSVQVVPCVHGGCWVGGSAIVNGKGHLVVLHYDGKGKLLWTGMTPDESGFSKLVADNDTVFACGAIERRDSLGARLDWMVARFDSDGKLAWEQLVLGPGYGGAASDILLNKASLYISGVFQTGPRNRGGHGLNMGVAAIASEDGRLYWTKWQEMDSLDVICKGMVADEPGVWLRGTRTSFDHSEHLAMARYDGQGELIWERDYDAPPGYRNVVCGALNHSNDWLGIVLTPAHLPDVEHGDLLALAFDSDGGSSYAFAFRPLGADLNSPRAISMTENGIGYIAAQSKLPSGPTLTVTKFHVH